MRSFAGSSFFKKSDAAISAIAVMAHRVLHSLMFHYIWLFWAFAPKSHQPTLDEQKFHSKLTCELMTPSALITKNISGRNLFSIYNDALALF